MRNRIFQIEDEEASEDAYIPGSHPQPLSTFFFREKQLNFVQKYPDGTTVRLSRDDVISVLKAEQAFDAQRNLDQFFYKISHRRLRRPSARLPPWTPCGQRPRPLLFQRATARYRAALRWQSAPETRLRSGRQSAEQFSTRRDRIACHRRTAPPTACDTRVR